MRLQLDEKDVNIVAEKMAYGGTTRFEDLERLPLGISVNFTSFSAKMLAFLAYYPKLLVPFFALGEEADITVRPLQLLIQYLSSLAVNRRGEIRANM